ncbi:ParB/RepB/Spo0J family partition protein [Actinomycetospora straminea]|uniref:ParB-like N-terminal domain-containing protein n=1 Tax=Actinomycetospora straminea TaxID=663607 RepID=A0ABP9F722_9PSEU|nr:ParB N-terminal domain-containing protein [Actinomycetospora straminea]MDD7936750.1 ParB N-terminal domain-containing protein [Actinomycetospora straminea]
MSATPTVERKNVDPKELLLDVNVRQDTQLDPDFVASVRENGVLVPLAAVRTASGDLRVRFGHRRTLAAIKAGHETVPVDVIGNEGDDDATQIERILGQFAENEHRAGLTDSEKIDAVQQLSAFGMKPTQIAKRARIAKEDVKARRHRRAARRYRVHAAKNTFGPAGPLDQTPVTITAVARCLVVDDAG